MTMFLFLAYMPKEPYWLSPINTNGFTKYLQD